MKKFYSLLLILFAGYTVFGQSNQPCVPCLTQGITFTTQSQIDSFPINHPNCTQIEGSVIIWSNGIINLNGLNSITAIGGNLDISHCNALTTMTGLDNLTYVAGDVDILNCTALTSLSGLENLTSMGGQLAIDSCTLLTNLTGIENLTTIWGGLTIGRCYLLTSLTGLNKLTSIDGNLVIVWNNVLTNLIGLDSLTHVGNQLWIFNNDDLTSLSGLDNIDENSISELWIYDNPSLSNCAVQSICDYLANPNGIIAITNNAQGCYNQQQIENACATIGVELLTPQPSITIYPNPVLTTITIENTTKGIITIYTIGGQQLLQQEITEPSTTINVSGLKNGVYFVRLMGEKNISVGKFIKQ